MYIKNNLLHTLQQKQLTKAKEDEEKTKVSLPSNTDKEVSQADGNYSNLQIKKAMEQANASDPEREKRIDELKTQVKQGTYQVDIDELASNLLARSVDEDLF